MIEPVGSAIDRLVPELRAGGFMRVKSSNYQEAFKRGDVTVAYSCGRYGEESLCFVSDADHFRFRMGSYLEIVDPPASGNPEPSDVRTMSNSWTSTMAIMQRSRIVIN